MAAGGGYGGSTPATPTPLGFNTLVAAYTFGSAGGTLWASTAGGTLEIQVPKKEAKIQVAVTKGDTASIKDSLEDVLTKYKVITAFGILLKKGNKSASVSSKEELTITFSDHLITKTDKVAVYSPKTGKFVPLSGVTVKNRQIIVHLTAGETIAIIRK